KFLCSNTFAPLAVKNSIIAVPATGEFILRLNRLLYGFGNAVTCKFSVGISFNSSTTGVVLVSTDCLYGSVAVRILQPSNALLIVATAFCTSVALIDAFTPPNTSFANWNKPFTLLV